MISKFRISLLCSLFLSMVFTSVGAQTSGGNNVALTTANTESVKSCVLLIHGLARTSSSMKSMEQALVAKGYVVANVDYPSRTQTIEQLAPLAFSAGFADCKKQNAEPHFVVTHSLGGILLRQYLQENSPGTLQKAVMLAPPNKGSEVVDALKDVPGYRWLNGPAGDQLGTGTNSKPLQLGPVSMNVAVIAGSFSINLVLSTYLPDPDDGKVSVESTKIDGMCAHLVVDVSHPYIMKNETVINEVISYLESDRFQDPLAEYPECSARQK